MIVTLGEFVIANGLDRTVNFLGSDTFSLTQETQTETPLRGEWPVFFHSRASRVIELAYRVHYPPCADLPAALLQARTIAATCPRGGELVEQHGATEITFEDAKLLSLEPTRRGVSNEFLFKLAAKNPSTAALSTLAQMSTNYIANLATITSLTGGTATDLDSLTTTDVNIRFTCYICPTIGGVAQGKHMRLIADPAPGVTTENADPTAGPLVILPDDYNETTNAKIWVEC